MSWYPDILDHASWRPGSAPSLGDGCHTGEVPDSPGPFDPDNAHVYDVQDRGDQLVRFMTACQQIAMAFEDGTWPGGEAYLQLADRAQRLLTNLATPTANSGLRKLGSALPPKPYWMDPRMPDYNQRRSPWQDEAAAARHRADHAALELRAWATYDPPPSGTPNAGRPAR